MKDRLRRFREYMLRLDAGANPQVALERGLYVPRAGAGRALPDEIAGRLELHPGSTHLVAGGIGSGKTTQILVATQRLSALPDTLALYVDVSAEHDISKLAPEVLLVLAAHHLEGQLDAAARHELSVVLKELEKIRSGYAYFQPDYELHHYEPPDPDDDLRDDEPPDYEPPGEYVCVPGIIVPPATKSKESPRFSRSAPLLKRIKDRVAARVPHVIVLFDGMDRLVDVDRFEQVVVQDLAQMQAMGIGVVMVGPTKLLYGQYRQITNNFDKHYPVTWPDPKDVAERAFLLRVLEARAPQGILSAVGAQCLVELSGGVLRDLVGIARNAGEEAYLSGDAEISAAHAEIAGETFGRGLLFGLDSVELETLKEVAATGRLVLTSDKDIALLTSGRVLQYQTPGPSARYDVHPTIRALLPQLG